MCSGASVEKEEKPRSSVIPRSCRTWCFEDSMPRASRSWWLRLPIDPTVSERSRRLATTLPSASE
ncbi:unnamed protein product [Cladocopium goreaui]|nr:unnamed protein product [Cladocopium goreaui]